ncbi:hypothetical protein BW39_01337 [Delftia sp. RIT313]|nr:hypothetical protein BW39_01337 [Delftia sp. RIT313]
MPLLLRLFFIRRSKNNRRRSHAGSEGRTVFQKNRRARLSGAWACPDEGLLQRNWRACVQKIPDRFARHGRMHEDKTSSRPRRNAVERALFHNGLCTGRGRLQESAACQADASGCARGSVRSFKKIQPLVAGLQEDCASRSGAADPVQARAITKSDGCWRTRARGRESARALQRPAEDRGGLAAVRPWVARASASWAFCWPVGGVWRVWPGRGAGTVCEIQRYPAGSGDRAAQACREMREPGNTVAHRLCASGLWAIGKLAD